MEQQITSAPAEVVEVGSQPGLTRLVNPEKEEGILGAEVGLHGNMKVRQGYWTWIFGMWKVLKAKCAKKAVIDIFE